MKAVGIVLLLVALGGTAVVGPARAPQSVQIDGTVLWVSGDTLTLRLDTPLAYWYEVPWLYWYERGRPYLVPQPGLLWTVPVDLSDVPQTEYAFLRSGERISVTGMFSADRRRLIAVSITRGVAPQTP